MFILTPDVYGNLSIYMLAQNFLFIVQCTYKNVREYVPFLMQAANSPLVAVCYHREQD